MKNKELPIVQFKHRSVVGKCKRTCYLLYNNWDDYGLRTTFDMHFVTSAGEEKFIGRVSITSKGLSEGKVELTNNEFTHLSEKYCSLGQGQGYYEELMSLSKEDREAILIGLRDCVYQQDIFNEFESEKSVQESLLRHVTIQNVKTLFLSILKGNAVPTAYDFSYKINNIKDAVIQVNVKPFSNPPSNIHVLIGRNGVGKTRMLSGIADGLSENKSPSDFSLVGDVTFNDENIWSQEYKNERFSSLITVAFSAFDKFSPINNNANVKLPCQYIGLKSETGNSYRTPESLEEDFNKSVKICLTSERKRRWIDAIKILNSDPVFKSYYLDQISEDINSAVEKLNNIFKNLSSGHKITLFTITKLVEFVDDKTLVLIDEPECHLHPPLLASFIRAISDLLSKRNAVSIIATHSPVVLQEVPKSCVTKIERKGEAYAISRPRIETYAENIGTITREIFQLELKESGFYKTINDYLRKQTNYENLISDFGHQIGAEGRALALSILSTKVDSD